MPDYYGFNLRNYEVTLYHPNGRCVPYRFQARDYWDARAFLDLQFPGVEYNWLKEL